MSHELPTWLDGPALVRWLEELGLASEIRSLGVRGRADLFRWRQPGAAANYYTVERLLFDLGCHHLLQSLPNSAWRDKQPNFTPVHLRRRAA